MTSTTGRPARHVSAGRARFLRTWPGRLTLALGVLAVLYAAAQLALGLGDVPRGTSVAGVDVGNRSIADARATIERELGARASAPMRVSVEGETLQFAPADAGLAVDAQASAERAAHRPWAPWSVAAALFGERDVDPVVTVDDERLRAAVTALGAEVDQALVEGDVVFTDGKPTAVEPQAGRVLDVDDAAQRLREAFVVSSAPVPLSFTVEEPTVSAAEVQRALEEVAEPAVSGPVRLRVDDDEITASALDVAAALSFEPEGGSLVASVDGAVLAERLAEKTERIEREPVDARIELQDGAPAVVPAVIGRTVTPAGLATAVQEAMLAPQRRAPLPLQETEPELTTAEARELGVTEKVGEFTTQHPCCAARVTNIQRMADIVDGALVLPGETFSLNGHVGERTTAKGFVPAPMILRGLFVDSVGGGVSQFATTMYNAAFFGGFPIPEYKAHSYYISRYPAGREATVSWPDLDLKWRNDSQYGVLVTTSYTSTSITVTLWSTKRFDIESASSGWYRMREAPEIVYNDKPGCSPASGAPGFDIDVTRIFKRGGDEVKRETVTTRYLPEPVMICGTKPTPTPTPTASPKPSPTTPKPSPPKPSPKPTPTAAAEAPEGGQ